jgi:hypothetical protein
MTFKQFINDEVMLINEGKKFVSSLKYDENKNIFKILKKDCSEFLRVKNQISIFRGFSGGNKLWYISTPSKFTRTSKQDAGGNIYTLLFDNLNSWQKFPKRSKSLICTTDYQYSNEFGRTYLVIPKDGAKWGICPEGDIWKSFNRTSGKYNIWLEDFNFLFINTFKLLNKHFPEKFKNFKVDELKFSKDFNYLFKVLLAMDECIDIIISDEFMRKNKRKYENIIDNQNALLKFLIYKKQKTNKNIGFILEELFDPEQNKFVLANNLNISKMVNKNNHNEVWTDSDCILINIDKFINFLEKEEGYYIDDDNEILKFIRYKLFSY